MSSGGAAPLALSAAALRAVDRHAEETLKIPGVVLMENAGAGAARVALAMLGDAGAPPDATCMVFCGGGGNGGDGYVVARHLALSGRRVLVLHAAESSSGDAAVMREVVERMHLDQVDVASEEALERFEASPRGQALHSGTENCALLIDALLGTGFRGSLRPVYAGLLRLAQDLASADLPGASLRTGRSRTRRLALDLPSGMRADERTDPGCLVFTADKTATFAAEKLAFAFPEAGRWTGQVEICSIGAPVTPSSEDGSVSSRY